MSWTIQDPDGRQWRVEVPELRADPGTGQQVSGPIQPGPGPSGATLIKAGIPNDLGTKLRIFAQARFPDLPPEQAAARYGIKDGRLYYVDTDGQLRWETSGWDRVREFAGEVVGGLPVDIGAVAGFAAGGIPGAIVGGMAGEKFRQRLGQKLFDEPISPMGAAGRMALAGGASALGGALGRRTTRGLDVALSPDRQATRGAQAVVREAGDFTPLDPARERRVRALMGRYGISEPTVVETTGSKRLIDRFSLLGDLPATAEAVQAIQQRRMGEVVQAVDDFLRQLAPDATDPLLVGQRVQQAAQTAVARARTAPVQASGELYRQAYATAPPVNTRPVVDTLEELLKELPKSSAVAKRIKALRRMIVVDEKAAARQAPTPRPPPQEMPQNVVEFPAPEVEREALRAQMGGKSFRADHRATAQASGITYEDRAILRGLADSGVLDEADQRLAALVAGGGSPTQWDTIRLKELVAAGREAATGPIPAPAGLTAAPTAAAPDGPGVVVGGAQLRGQPIRPAGLETDLKKLQVVKEEIDALLKGSDPEWSKLPGATQTRLRRNLTQAKDALLEAMDAASPVYAQARAVYAANMPAVERITGSSVGRVADLKGDQVVAATQRLIEGAFASPETVRYASAQIRAVDPKAWDGVVAHWLASKWKEVPQAVTGTATVNYGGRMQAKVLAKGGDRILEAALEHNPAKLKAAREWLEVLGHTGAIFRKESQTFPRMVAGKEMDREASRSVLGKVASTMQISFASPLARVGRWIEDVITRPEYQNRILQALQDPAVAAELANIKRLPPKSRFAVEALATFIAAHTGQEAPDYIGRKDARNRKPVMQ